MKRFRRFRSEREIEEQYNEEFILGFLLKTVKERCTETCKEEK